MLFKIIDYLIQNSHKLDKKILLNIVLRFGIPFNSFHPFKIEELSQSRARLKQKLTWFNKNHLRGMHACAISTAGELTAGLLLMKTFSAQKNRFILKSLSTEYHYQGRTHLFTEANFILDNVKVLKKNLKNLGKVDIELKIEITDKEEKHVATVETLWQIKAWNKVQST